MKKILKKKEEEAVRALQDVRKKELARQRKAMEDAKAQEVVRLAQSLKERGNLKVDLNVSFN